MIGEVKKEKNRTILVAARLGGRLYPPIQCVDVNMSYAT
jgi:hypothetical protein